MTAVTGDRRRLPNLLLRSLGPPRLLTVRCEGGTIRTPCPSSPEADYRLFWELIFVTIAADTHAAGRVKVVLDSAPS
jgi:hypothetical protein